MSSYKPLIEGERIYIQIAEILIERILSGTLKEESRVPSTNELARQYSINPATAAKGISILVEEGILYKQRGLGMFVAGGAIEKIRVQRRKSFYKDYVRPLTDEARALRLTDAELSIMVQRALDETDQEQILNSANSKLVNKE